jgi:hypothetical protein
MLLMYAGAAGAVGTVMADLTKADEERKERKKKKEEEVLYYL